MRIFDFATVKEWENRLSLLAEMAEPERWNFTCVPSETRLPVLDSYVRYTFLRVSNQGKVAENDQLACFNTGLLTPGQEEIFGVFTVSDRYDPSQPASSANKKWWLKAWVRSGDRLLSSFRALPALATYWIDPSDIVFNPNLQIQLNVDHIIKDNLQRFPVEFGGQLDTNGVPQEERPPDIEEESGANPSTVPGNEVVIPLATRNVLEGAMKHSIRLAQRSYRIAVPQFHHDRIQLLLPLYIRDAKRPDLALTLEHNGDWYRAATVLYPDWAYRHARLLSRPNSEWLGGFRTDLAREMSLGVAADGPTAGGLG
jgi:hypothetical protein